MSTEIIVIGSCMIDLVTYTPRLPKPGETLHGHKFSIGFGGKGANQCVVSARLGARCGMIGKVGLDSFGEEYIENLKKNGINTDQLQSTSEASTGVAPIAVDENGQNAIIIVPGANLLLTSGEVKKAETLIKNARVAVFQLEISLEATLAGLRLAKKHGVKTIMNPAPAQKTLDESLYQLSDIFCPNETEAEILTGVAIGDIMQAKKAIEILLGRGCHTVIITMGHLGAVFGSVDMNEFIHVPTTHVDPVDTTGAGDAFVGALAFYLAKYPQMSFETMIERANLVATKSVQAHGTQTSYPYKKDLPEDIF